MYLKLNLRHRWIKLTQLYLKIKGRPYGFGQSLGRPIVPGQFVIFFLVGRKKLERSDNYFCPLSWIFLSSLDIRDWTKNSREWTKKLSCLWDGIIFFWPTKKNEKLTGQLVGQGDWPKPHGRPYNAQCFFRLNKVPVQAMLAFQTSSG